MTLGSTLLINLITRLEMQKAHNRALLQEEKSKRAKIILDKQEYIENLKNYLTAVKEGKAEKDTLKTLYKQNQQKAIANNDMAAAARYAGLIAQLDAESIDSKAVQANIEKEIALTESEVTGLKIQQTQTDIKLLENGKSFTSILGHALSILTPILTIMSMINMVQQAINVKKMKEIALQETSNRKEKEGLLAKVTGMFAKVVSAFSSGGIPGVIAGIALATALAAALGVGIAAAMGAFNKGTAADSAADNINKLSNEIYKLNEKANAIKTIEDQFDALDKKIIKTAEDQEKLNELLDSAGDKLSAENKKDSKGKDIAGTSEQDIYNALETEQDKYNYLQQAEKNARQRVEDLRRQQLNILESLNEASRKELLTNQTNTEYLKVQSAVRATVNQQLYDTVDLLKDAKKGTEEFTQAILNQMSASELYKYAIEDDANSIKKLVDTVNKATTWKNGQEFHLVDILGSDDYSFKERIEAFGALEQKINAIGDSAIMKNFKEAYQQ